ncbi:putative fasciclin-like arabinogalactan protein 20 [Arachis stenosperma]|uniref:putative fasciclin-like arabinogalactan protein 20 n=1 Tax=Arachis stenosperma TaxID=217475 RepID=UPI0025AB9852|nr:putative fasciclin-like arabinogalactan protein 20 [Arachis stenosperma]
MEEKQHSTACNLLYLITYFTLLLLPTAATTATDINVLRCLILLQRLPIENISSLPPNFIFPTLNRTPPLDVNGFIERNYYVSETSLFPTTSLPYFAIDNSFFNISPVPEISLLEPVRNNADPFAAVARVLKDYGCSCMATFLDAQLSKEYRNGTNFTIFAPLDVAFPEAVKRNISYYSAIFRKHVVPRLLTWRDLISLPDNTLLPTLFSNDYSIRVTVSWMVRYVNGVLVVVPDMHRSDFVVVHGIRRLLDNTIV